MEYFEIVRTGFLVVGFLLAMSRDRTTWMTVDLIGCVVMGCAWVFIPQILLDFQTEGELTSYHYVIGRVFGIVMLCYAVKAYLNYKSHDAYSQVMLLAARIVSSAITLIIVIHSIYGPTEADDAKAPPPKVAKGEKAPPPPPKAAAGLEFNDQWKYLTLTTVPLVLIGCIIWFLKAHHYGGHTSLDSRLNIHLRLDFFLTLVGGCVWLAYTPSILKLTMSVAKVDTVQLHLGQSIGAMLIGDAILSAVAPGFLFEEDKRNILAGRAVMLIGLFINILHAIITYEGFYDTLYPWVGLFVLVAWFANTAMGHHAPHETSGYRKYTKVTKTTKFTE